MKRKSFISLVAFLLLGGARAARAQSPGGATEKNVDAVFSAASSPDAPGFAVLVRKDGRAVFERGYGLRDLHAKTKIDAHTNFRLASFTKQFTAMAIMLLVHDRKLRYDESLTQYFPDFPSYAKGITIRNLLNHTSGLPDYEDLMAAEEKTKGPIWTPEHQIQDEEVLQLLEKASKEFFAPGTAWAYSNSGYVVLGLLVARVSGKSFGDFLGERIFSPLRMDHTVLYVKGKNDVANRAYGHTKDKDGGTFKETDQSPTSATQGDGGVYSNLEDLAKWDDALQNHSLLSEKEFQSALTPVKLNDGSDPRWPKEPNDDNLHPELPVSYGFGWFLDPYQAHQRMWHTGSTIGFFTVIERFIDERLTVIILSNRSDWHREKVAQQVADIFLSTKN